MMLRKISTDNSVKFIPSINSSPSESSHYQKPNTVSSPRKQNKKFPENNKKIH